MSKDVDARTLEDVGEFALIERIARAAREQHGERVRVGIGDDAAVLQPTPGFELVVSADTFVEDVHFRFASRSPADVGRDALLVNLSDLAAMGARPIGFTVALQAPPTLALDAFDGLVEGIVGMGVECGAPLVGGNLSRASETSLAITVLGEVEAGRALLRSGLQPGDSLFATGRFGENAARVLEAERLGEPVRFEHGPRLDAGRALVGSGLCSACIDCSDGLAADLGHMLEASGVGAEIDAAAIPRAQDLELRAGRLGVEAEALCLEGGEDYELIFGLRPPLEGLPSSDALSDRLGVMVTEIGVATGTPALRGLTATRGHAHF